MSQQEMSKPVLVAAVGALVLGTIVLSKYERRVDTHIQPRYSGQATLGWPLAFSYSRPVLAVKKLWDIGGVLVELGRAQTPC